jgi:hypothetical protein
MLFFNPYSKAFTTSKEISNAAAGVQEVTVPEVVGLRPSTTMSLDENISD